MFGVGAVLVTIGFGANVCIGLWTRSTVEAVAQDAARDIAASPDGAIAPGRVDEVIDRARRRLGPTGARTSMRVERSDDEVVLHVTHPGVSLVPRMIDHGLSVGAIDERIVVRHEGAGP